MPILTWLIVGLVAGVLASLVMGGSGYGLIGDIIIGIIGAFVGGWLFRTLGTSSPCGGLGGVIFVAFIGAVVLFLIQNEFSDSGVWYLVGLGAAAMAFALFLPQGVWGLCEQRFGIRLLPVGYRLRRRLHREAP